MDGECYYDNDLCDYSEGVWECETCEEQFCAVSHNHVTEKGADVECVGCERERSVAPVTSEA